LHYSGLEKWPLGGFINLSHKQAKEPMPLKVFSLVLLDFYQLYILWLDSNLFGLHLLTFQKFAVRTFIIFLGRLAHLTPICKLWMTNPHFRADRG